MGFFCINWSEHRHTLHCVTVATNGTFYTWLWTVRQLLGTSLCILCLCCGQCLPEKNLSSIYIVVTHIPSIQKRNLEIIDSFTRYHSAKRIQKANHFPQCTRRKPSLAELRQSTNIQELVGSLANERLNRQFDKNASNNKPSSYLLTL